jgi:hypothetical protein
MQSTKIVIFLSPKKTAAHTILDCFFSIPKNGLIVHNEINFEFLLQAYFF